MTTGYISPTDFGTLTGITSRNATQVALAIESAAQEMRRILYVRKVEQFSSQATTFQLSKRYFADYDLSGVVDKLDVNVWETQSVNGLLQWTKLTNATDITSIDEDAGQITFATTRPTAGKSLVIEYWWTRFKCSDMLNDLKVLNKLMAVEECYKMMMAEQLQNGISQWSIGDVNIQFDVNAVNAQIANNQEQISRKMRLLKPFVMVGAKDIAEYDLADKLRTPRYI